MSLSSVNSKKVLLVEDAIAERMRLRAILEREGYQVLEASDGESALSLLQGQTMPLIVSDWQMPGMSGLQLCRRIRQDKAHNSSYILILTGRNSREDLLEAFAAGTDDFLPKPVDRDELLARLRVGRRLWQLQADLSKQNEQVRQALERETQARAQVDAELRAASELQLELLPAPRCDFKTLQLVHLFQPAAGLGGDMLNYIELNDNTVAFYLLDVCGHGVASALLSFAIAHEIGEMFSSAGSADNVIPEQVMQRLNSRFLDRSGNARYFTMVLGVIDQSSGKVRICQAAHPPPLLQRQNGQVEPVAGGGLPVGVFERATFESSEITLQQGDQLIIFSDGLTECEDPDGTQFGPERLSTRLSSLRGHSPEYVLEDLRAALVDWQGQDRFIDDLSIMIMARRVATQVPQFEQTLMSQPDEIADTVDRLGEWLSTQGVETNLAFQFCVCIAEALNNIEEHGYGEGRPGPIALNCRVSSDALECEIHDQAEPARVPDQVEIVPGDVESSRGWFILKSWMDKLVYAPAITGNHLRLVKFID